MSKTLEFGNFCLVSRRDKLKLCVTSVVHLNPSTSLLQSQSDRDEKDILNALISGNIWVSHGPPFSLDFYLGFDNMLLEKGSWLPLLDSFGSRMREAELWSELSLVSSLEIAEANRLSRLKPDFSICIAPNKAPASLSSQYRTWPLEDINTRRPDSVPTAELVRLQIHLGFHRISGGRKPAVKRVKSVPAVNEHIDTMLLDRVPAAFRNTDLDKFQSVFECPAQDRLESISRGYESLGQSPIPVESQYGNRDSEAEDDMMCSTHRVKLELVESTEEDMLLSQDNRSMSSLVSQSTLLSDLTPWPPPSSLKRTASESQLLSEVEIHSTLDTSSAYKLTETAMQILISGHDSHSIRGRGVKTEGPLPGESLSILAPGIFNPGFRDSLANNVRFLPTISQAISYTWLRNVQSPSLRKKLTGLASLETAAPRTPWQQNSDSENGTSRCLAAVVQARLWSMMQRKLHDPSASKKLSWGRSNTAEQATATEYERQLLFEDLLKQVRDENDENGWTTEGLLPRGPEELIEDDFNGIGDEFEDLLDDIGDDEGDDDELLNYLDKIEMERMRGEVELVTEISLDGEVEEKQCVLLFQHETADEFMLV